MTLIVEDGTGIFEANSYAGFGFVRNYLNRRNRHTEWDAATKAVQEAALIAATDYIDTRFGLRFKGIKEFRDIAVAASNVLEILSNSINNSTITIGSTTYTYRNSLSGAFEILIGGTTAETAANTIAAINAGAGAGTTYGTGTTAHPDVVAKSIESLDDVFLKAKVAGTAGNSISTTSSSDNLRFDTITLVNGDSSVEQQREFPRKFLYTSSGSLVEGIPENLKSAVAEYASRAISAILMPDPVVSEEGQLLTRKIEKVGPIEEHTHFWASQRDIFKKYPAADRLLIEYLVSPGGVMR